MEENSQHQQPSCLQARIAVLRREDQGATEDLLREVVFSELAMAVPQVEMSDDDIAVMGRDHPEPDHPAVEARGSAEPLEVESDIGERDEAAAELRLIACTPS